MKSLNGKVAVVTGANRGLGLAFVEELLARGAKQIYAFTRKPSVVKQIFSGDERVVPVEVELCELASIQRAAEVVAEADLLINSAAMLTRGNLLDADGLERLQAEWEVNVRGNLAIVRALAPKLFASREAALVQVNSIAALCPFADVLSYAATKAAALSLTQALRRELAPRGIPVFSVLPVPLATDMAAWLDCAKANPREVAVTVLNAVLRGESHEIFPDEGGGQFFTQFRADPVATIFHKT